MRLRIQLRSDAAFGRGDGIAGLVDSEVEHDPRTGLPFIKGRTIKGLLVESCADLLYGLGGNSAFSDLVSSAEKLFGVPGSTLDDMGCLHVGSAQLPDDLQQYLAKTYQPQQILQALSTIRHQTAVDMTSDTPKDGSLRATRVVLRETIFYSELHITDNLETVDYQLLAACAAGIKRGGQNRTRGLGWLKIKLLINEADDKDTPDMALKAFIKRIGGAA
jgi:CRISPR/Cas system CSM-associated protein Csm3 (group 7 of RAMP superfamily)